MAENLRIYGFQPIKITKFFIEIGLHFPFAEKYLNFREDTHLQP
jgi:hypothetical protein